MLDKIRQFFASRRVVDVPPPNTQLPLRDRRNGAGTGDSGQSGQFRDPLAGADVERPAGLVLDEPTEELLTLSEDSERTQPGGGRNPYDTGPADRSGAWRNRLR